MSTARDVIAIVCDCLGIDMPTIEGAFVCSQIESYPIPLNEANEVLRRFCFTLTSMGVNPSNFNELQSFFSTFPVFVEWNTSIKNVAKLCDGTRACETVSRENSSQTETGEEDDSVYACSSTYYEGSAYTKINEDLEADGHSPADKEVHSRSGDAAGQPANNRASCDSQSAPTCSTVAAASLNKVQRELDRFLETMTLSDSEHNEVDYIVLPVPKKGLVRRNEAFRNWTAEMKRAAFRRGSTF